MASKFNITTEFLCNQLTKLDIGNENICIEYSNFNNYNNNSNYDYNDCSKSDEQYLYNNKDSYYNNNVNKNNMESNPMVYDTMENNTFIDEYEQNTNEYHNNDEYFDITSHLEKLNVSEQINDPYENYIKELKEEEEEDISLIRQIINSAKYNF